MGSFVSGQFEEGETSNPIDLTQLINRHLDRGETVQKIFKLQNHIRGMISQVKRQVYIVLPNYITWKQTNVGV